MKSVGFKRLIFWTR